MLSMVQAAIKYWRTHIIRSDLQGAVLCSFVWIGIGFFNIYSATMIGAADTAVWYESFYFKHAIYLAISFTAGYFAYRIDYTHFRNSKILYGFTALIIAGLIAVMIKGDVINGAQRWIRFGGVSIQPSEFAKLGAILLGAHYIDLQRRVQKKGLAWFENSSYKWPFSWPKFMVGGNTPVLAKALHMPIVFALLTLIEPDTGTAALILVLPIILFMVGGLSRKSWISFISLCIVLAIPAGLGIRYSDYRWARIKAWWDPWEYAQSLSYQSVQSMVAIGSGGVLGQGVAQGTAKYYYLPEAHTDFAFAVWAQETGLIGSFVLVAMVGLFIIYGFRIASNAKDYYGKLLATGITFIIGGQAVFNMLMVCGVFPVTGVPLPFVSYGGSSLFMNVVAICILFNIAHRTALAKKKIGVAGHIPSLREETRSRFAPSNRG